MINFDGLQSLTDLMSSFESNEYKTAPMPPIALYAAWTEYIRFQANVGPNKMHSNCQNIF